MSPFDLELHYVYCPYSGSKDYVARPSDQLLKDQLFDSSPPLLAWSVGSVLPAYKPVIISKTGSGGLPS